MYFLFSGEGPTDLGLCATNTYECEGEAYNHGPMTIIVDQIVEEKHGYSFLEGKHYGFVSTHTLGKRTKKLRAIRFPGKKRRIETMYYYRNARAFAQIALERQQVVNDDVVAILFRDSDETSSAGRGYWADKRQAMLNGFEMEKFSRGVPMIPKPKSEAWLLCALKENPYQGCAGQEDRSGNDRSPNSLKGELEKRLGRTPSRAELCEMVNNQTVDIRRIDMPSFNVFRNRLKEVI